MYLYFKDNIFAAVKGDAKFQIRFVKGVYHLSVEGTREGHLCFQKWLLKVRGWTSGQSLLV